MRQHLASKEVDASTPGALKNIDFRRGSDGAGRLVVDLGSAMVNADVRKEGKGLTIDLLNSSLPAELRRRLDVVDFATPVQMITASQNGDRVRLQVEATGDWVHSAYQSDEQFVLEVRPKKVDPNKLSQGPGFTGERLSLNFQNIDVRALLQVIADFTNFNIVTSDTVGGSLTLRLKDVPWDQALNIIMEAKGLGMKKNGNVLWIAPKMRLMSAPSVTLKQHVPLSSWNLCVHRAFRSTMPRQKTSRTRLQTTVATARPARVSCHPVALPLQKRAPISCL